MITKTNVADFNSGMADKKAGYYDKWYRYNRKDDGAAYDNGFNSVETNNPVIIIEVAHNSLMNSKTLGNDRYAAFYEVYDAIIDY